MPYASKIVLHCPHGYTDAVDRLVEDFLSGGVKFVGVVGLDCERIEDIVDELVVGDGGDSSRFLLTSSHPGASLQEAVRFARALVGEYEGEVQVVEV
jgi:hypothetical protein